MTTSQPLAINAWRIKCAGSMAREPIEAGNFEQSSAIEVILPASTFSFWTLFDRICTFGQSLYSPKSLVLSINRMLLLFEPTLEMETSTCLECSFYHTGYDRRPNIVGALI